MASSIVTDQDVVEWEAGEAAREWPVVVKLKIPIEFGSEHIEELTFRRGQLKDADGVRVSMGDVPIDTLVTIASRMCGRPVQQLKKLDIDDVGEVTAIALGFYAKLLRAGKKP